MTCSLLILNLRMGQMHTIKTSKVLMVLKYTPLTNICPLHSRHSFPKQRPLLVPKAADYRTKSRIMSDRQTGGLIEQALNPLRVGPGDNREYFNHFYPLKSSQASTAKPRRLSPRL